MKSRAYISLITLVVLAYGLFRVAHLYPKWDKHGSESVLSWDVFGYYLYLPAVFLYDDLAQLEFKDEIFEAYYPATEYYHSIELEDGNQVLRYPVGLALLWAPFFWIGHLMAGWQGLPQDGFSQPYQFMIAMGSIVYALLGLIALRKLLLRYFKDLTVAVVLAVLVFSTNYLNYVAYDGAMPHNALFSFYAVILLLTAAWHETPRWWVAGLLGIALGWATITRPTDLLSVLIPICWGLHNRASLKEKWQQIIGNWSHLLLVGGGMFVMGMMQLAYWKYVSGNWLFYSYGEYGFDWLNPHLKEGLIGYRKGWLVYTPVMSLSVLGLIPLFTQHRDKFLAVVGYFLPVVYVVFSWSIWWYGGSFGARPLVQSYAVLALPLAAAISFLWTKRWLTIAGIAFILLCTDLNLVMTWQAHASGSGWNAEYMTKKYYWKIFGNTNVQRADKLFLDVRRELKDTRGMQVRELYHNDFETDTLASSEQAYESQRAWKLSADAPFSPGYKSLLSEFSPAPGGWVRVSADILYIQPRYNEWGFSQLVTVFYENEQAFTEGKVLRRTGARMHWLTDPWRWHHMEYEMRIPKQCTPESLIQVYAWNANGKTDVWIDNLKVELIEPN
ncbi:MAG: hypothetical protein AAF399_19240 [Bacteroidota bacterium]